jgi:hypothetical protein
LGLPVNIIWSSAFHILRCHGVTSASIIMIRKKET